MSESPYLLKADTPPSVTLPAYHVEGVSKTVLDGTTPLTILRDVSFTIEPGEFIGVQGYSGSGKSTLVNLLSAIDTPTTGQVRFFDTDLSVATRAEQTQARRDIGLVFQAYHLIASHNVFDNVALPLVLRGLPTDEIAGRVLHALFEVNLLEPEADQSELLQRLREFARRPLKPRFAARVRFRLQLPRLPHRRELGLIDRLPLSIAQRNRLAQMPATLSGGQMQRVAIARAIVAQPRVILADEPTGNLDPKTAQQVIEVLHQIHAQSGRTVLLVSHDERLIDACPRKLRLHEGRVFDVRPTPSRGAITTRLEEEALHAR